MIGPFAIYPFGTVLVRMIPMAEALHSRGHEVSIVLPPTDNLGESGREYKLGNVAVYNVIIPREFDLKTSIPVKHLLVGERVVRKALELKPEIIHIFAPTNFSGTATILLILRRWLGLVRIPILVDVDDWMGYGGFYNYFLSHGRGYRYQLDFNKFLQEWIPKNVDAVTVANRTLQALVWNLNVGQERVFYLPNGPHELGSPEKQVYGEDLQKKFGLENRPTILLYTRFFEYDPKRVVDILKIVKSTIKNAMLLVVGKSLYGYEEKRFLELVEKERLSESVIFAGWIQYEDLPLYLKLGEVAIYPFDDTLLNRTKCPGKVVELMSIGKAVIADRVGQIAEYIENGSSGILVDPGDSEAFAQSIITLLKNEDLRTRIGKNAKERIWSKFHWNRLVLEAEKAYEKTKSQT
jgi:glycosyltransferase involved in cell wall biosynthesis